MMKIVENNVKCGEIIIFDHKFYKKKTTNVKFCPHDGDVVKKFVPWRGLGF